LSYYVNIHTKQDLRDWFEKEYKLALKFIRVRSRKYIYNIDKKGCCLVCFARENVIVLIRIKKMYIKVLKNRFSVTVVKSIFANGKAILSLVIVPGRNIIISWFNKQITGTKVVSVLLFGYTNKGICIQ
jgi:hypothetical protein